MEINLEIPNSLEDSELRIHYIPASIDQNGSGNIEKYFEQYTITEDGGLMTNSLRGYPLKGCVFNIPENYRGVVFQKDLKSLNNEADKVFKVLGTFSKFTYWNYDKIPSRNDAIRKALTVLDVADALNKDLSEEELDALIKEESTKP